MRRETIIDQQAREGAYAKGIIRATRTLSVPATKAFCLSLRFRFRSFLVRMWLPKALLLRIFPVPVFLKRLEAPLLVFSFGDMISPARS